MTIIYFCNSAVLLLELCLRISLIIVLVFDIFLILYDTIANITLRLCKFWESNSLSILEINSSFLRNLLNYNTLGFLGSLNYLKEIAFWFYINNWLVYFSFFFIDLNTWEISCWFWLFAYPVTSQLDIYKFLISAR